MMMMMLNSDDYCMKDHWVNGISSLNFVLSLLTTMKLDSKNRSDLLHKMKMSRLVRISIVHRKSMMNEMMNEDDPPLSMFAVVGNLRERERR